ncbi:MAG TPA: UDP-glucose 4-epimerase GalE [Pyrinomonadaceae bacterium]|nr:UDP-glucose 4-epimerase GalE [Pyrinomonadaceae bacterium]
MNILVTGGAGYIGSVVVEETLRSGHKTVVYDNLIKGHREMVAPDALFVEGDLLDREKLESTLRENSIDAVIHMAAYSLVGESVAEPEKYYQNNVVAGLSLLDAMRECGVSKIVFSSTAATYGEPEKQPIEESDRTAPTNPYGDTKLAFEHALKAYDAAYGMKYVSLRYFNAAGASERCGEIHDPETHLIPIVLQVAAGSREAVEVYGDDYTTRDGTCVRDYIHVIDLARAHVLALKRLETGSATFNLGCGGDGYTVKEVIDAARAVTGREIAVRVAKRRPGDPAVLIASSDKIREALGWKPEFQDLSVIIESAWKWMQRQSAGKSA